MSMRKVMSSATKVFNGVPCLISMFLSCFVKPIGPNKPVKCHRYANFAVAPPEIKIGSHWTECGYSR